MTSPAEIAIGHISDIDVFEWLVRYVLSDENLCSYCITNEAMQHAIAITIERRGTGYSLFDVGIELWRMFTSNDQNALKEIYVSWLNTYAPIEDPMDDSIQYDPMDESETDNEVVYGDDTTAVSGDSDDSEPAYNMIGYIMREDGTVSIDTSSVGYYSGSSS
jgi:hypothetical protein